MAAGIVSILLTKLSSILEDELNILSRVPGEVAHLRDELKFMKAFLLDADAAVRGSGGDGRSEKHKVWIEQVRDVAFDTEDILDEALLRLYSDKRREGNWITGLMSSATSTSKSLKARRRLGAELERIKRRVERIEEAHGRYGGGVPGGGSSSETSSSALCNELRNVDRRLLQEAQLVGIEEPKRELRALLLDGASRLQAVAVVGMGGLGKTTLVSQVYADAEVKQRFEHRVWITVSQSFKLDDLLRSIIQELFENHKEEVHLAEEARSSTDTYKLKATILDFLRDKRYLLVLDDAWRVDSWDAIQNVFPNNDCGSRLMLTTRTADVASSCIRSFGGNIYRLKFLSKEESWTLFCEKTFGGSDCPSLLKSSCENILKRCEGLPLAIVAIGGMLATKDTSSIDQFERVHRSLGAELEGNDKLRSMETILSLSFNDLPGNLKSCLLYLTLFPEDDLVKNRLIRLWIAENFVLKQSERTLEEVGDAYFNELLNRCLIQVSKKHDDGRIKACRIHDLIREIILLRASEEYLGVIANKERRDFPETVRRLSVHKTVENVPEEQDFSKLRSLLLFGVKNFASSFSISAFLKGSQLLQVLDCGRAPIDSFPEEITKLYNLRYLSLRGTEVKSVPRSIAKLRNLQTLNLKNTGVKELPVEVLQISSLRHIHVYRSVNHGSDIYTEILGFKALRGINALSSLQTLCHLEAIEGGLDIMRSIGKLTQLRRLGVVGLNQDDGPALCSSINNLNHLAALDLKSHKTDGMLNLQSISSIPKYLQRLYLAGRLERLPHWIPKLLGLKSLILRFSGLRVDFIESLRPLSNLIELRLYRAYDGETLCFRGGCFPKLRILDLRKLDGLRSMIVDNKAIPLLERLIFEDCKLLKELPSGLKCLSNLKQLKLIDMDSELIKRIRQKDDEDEECLKIKNISWIYIVSRCGPVGANKRVYQYMSNLSSSGATNIIRNHDFVEGLSDWEARGCTWAIVDAEDQPDVKYAIVSNRSEIWHGLEQDITGKILPGSVYSISVVVRVSDSIKEYPSEVKATLRLEYEKKMSECVFVVRTYILSGRWKELKGTISPISIMPKSIMFRLEGPSPGVEISIRSVEIKESKVILNPRFDDGLSNWYGRGCEIFLSDSMGYGGYIAPFTGTSFAYTRNRKQSWDGIDQEITGRVLRKLAYEVTAVVRVFSSSTATKQSEIRAAVYIQTTDNREEYYEVAKVQATDIEWTWLQGKFLINGEPSRVWVYIKGPPPEIDILLDSLVIKRAENVSSSPPAVIENPAFGVNIIENSNLKHGTKGWFGLGDCTLSVEVGSPPTPPPVAAVSLEPYNNGQVGPSGLFLISTDRTEDWMGPAQMITEKLKLFLTYQVSAWVKVGSSASGPTKVSVRLEVVNLIEEVKTKSWINGGEVEADSDGWYEIAGSFRFEKQPARVMIYVFGPKPGIELMVSGLQVFAVDRKARFTHLRQQTDQIRKRDIILKLSGVSPITALKVRQIKNSFPLGSLLKRSNIDNEDLLKFFSENFNWAVFANELKWYHTEPRQGKFNYKDADEMLAFCQRNDIQVQCQCIFSENDSKDPEWVSLLNKKDLSKAVENRMKNLLTRYKGKIKHYGIKNGILNGSFYEHKLGENEIAKMFSHANRLDPNACLFTNEYDVDDGCFRKSSPKKYIQLIDDLKSKGADIRGIGIQGRNKCPVGLVVRSALDKLGELNLPIWYTVLKVSSANEHVRAEDLEVMIREAFAHPAVEGIMLSGFWELCMDENRENISHLINADGEPNEAGKRFLALKKEFLSNVEGNVDEDGKFEFRGFHGTYSVEVAAGSGTFSKTFDVERGDNTPLEVTIDV